MSDERFEAVVDNKGHLKIITDGEKVLNNSYEVVDLLNEQQSIIRRVEEENEELKDALHLLKEIHQKGSKSCEKWKQYKEAQIQQLEKENEDLREVNKENQRLHEENVKQCEKWRNLYELKDAEVTARVDALNKVCEYYLTKAQFKAETDPNEAVKEVINEILNTPIYKE